MTNSKGQALVEFALVITLLLLIIFVIIEAGRLFQAWVTVQNAARSAGRYAITGQYENSGNF
ncbi:MAG: TadE/TadG family type IV pilus assembly protein, partial [Candidatus Promineifilaceae bacterium]